MTLKEEIEKLSIKKHWFFTEKDSVTLSEYIRQREKKLLLWFHQELIYIIQKTGYSDSYDNAELLRKRVEKKIKELSKE